MEKERVKKTHILVIPIPIPGHINPMLQFSKRVGSKGVKVTFLTASPSAETEQAETSLITFKAISNTLRANEKLEDMLKWFLDTARERVPELIAEQEAMWGPLGCVVYDSGLPWVLDLAREAGVRGASFFTHSCAVACVYYNVNKGMLKIPLKGDRISLPGLPLLEQQDMPSFVSDPESYPSMLRLVISRFSNVADWIFFSSFDSLESEAVSWMRTLLPIKPIGPTIPSMYLDKRLEHDKNYTSGMSQTDPDACTKWLDSKERGSVVYVSFGSIANLGKEQMEELAEGLKMSECNILWVVRATELEKLPREFFQEGSEKVLVVNWCIQLEVLAHDSVGCFVTHCGWNSILEAISFGVPMVAMPQWTDQPMNAKFIVDVWNVGLRLRASESGFLGREEIGNCIKEVMRSERGREMKENALKWKELAKEAVSEGGSSDRNIEQFVAELISQTPC